MLDEKPTDAEAVALIRSFYTIVAGLVTAGKQEGEEWVKSQLTVVCAPSTL